MELKVEIKERRVANQYGKSPSQWVIKIRIDEKVELESPRFRHALDTAQTADLIMTALYRWGGWKKDTTDAYPR
jgi:hypothetical protein